MRQLESLLFSLGPAERARIRPLQFRGQKRTLFLRLLRCRTPEDVRRLHAWLDQTIDVQKRSLMYSQMLRACYDDLVPNGGIELLLFLGDKHLFPNLLSELRLQEGALAGDTPALARFYESVLVLRHVLLLDSKYGSRVWVEMDRIAECYAGISPEGANIPVFQTVIELVRTMSVVTHARFQAGVLIDQFRQLEDAIASVPTKGNVLTKFMAADCLRLQQVRDPERKQKVTGYGRMVLELVEAFPQTFGCCAELIKVSCLRNLPEGAQRLTTKDVQSFLTLRAVNHAFPYFQLGMFFGTLLSAGEGEWTERYLRAYCPRHLELMPTEPGFSISLMQMMHSAHRGAIAEGEQYLEFAFRRARAVRVSVSSQLIMRSMETYFVLMRGDFELGENLVARGLRYARTYGQHLARRPPVLFLRYAGALLRALPFDKDKAFDLCDKFDRESESLFFRMLFRALVARSFGVSVEVT